MGVAVSQYLYLWTLKFEEHLIFTYHETLLFCCFSTIYNVKPNLSLWTIKTGGRSGLADPWSSPKLTNASTFNRKFHLGIFGWNAMLLGPPSKPTKYNSESCHGIFTVNMCVNPTGVPLGILLGKPPKAFQWVWRTHSPLHRARNDWQRLNATGTTLQK